MSASKIARVAVCPGSLLAEEGLPNSTSEAAQRGTDIHEIAEQILRQQPVTGIDAEMLAIAQKYVTTAMEQTAHAKKHYIELDVTEALKTIHESLGGTADLIAIGGGVMTVCDLKTGRIEVSPENNLQLMTYALGAAIALNAPPTVTVRLAIYQPDHGGWREWSCTHADLMAWKDKLRDLAVAAHQPDAPRNPDQDACNGCIEWIPALDPALFQTQWAACEETSGIATPESAPVENTPEHCPDCGRIHQGPMRCPVCFAADRAEARGLHPLVPRCADQEDAEAEREEERAAFNESEQPCATLEEVAAAMRGEAV